MARKIVFFLAVGVITGALAGLAIADVTGDIPQFAAAEMSAEPGFTAVGGVADYWPEDNPNNLAAEEQLPAESRFTAVGGVADYWPEDSNTNLAQERGPVETGALPETSEGPANDAPTVETGGLMYRIGVDSP